MTLTQKSEPESSRPSERAAATVGHSRAESPELSEKEAGAGRLRRMLIAAALCTLLVAFIVKINQVEKTQLINRTGQTFEKAVVTEILEDNLQEDGTRVGEQVVRVRMTTGQKKGQQIEVTSSAGFLFGAPCTVGLPVIVMQSLAGDTVVASVYSRDRGLTILIFTAVYLAALVVIGGWKGVRGAAALVFAVLAVIFIELPLIYRGYSPYLVSVGVSAAATLVTMYLIAGVTKKSFIATLGTICGVVTAGIYAKIFSLATGITGWNTSNIESLMTLYEAKGIRVGDLLFSGLLISSLGAVMDVAMSVASSMEEILRQNPAITRKGLWQAGMRVGRDLMGTDSNTLILAFAGGSLSVLVLDYAYDLPWRQIINSNNIGISIMEGLAGSFGVVMTVPITVTLAAFLFSAQGKRRLREPGTGIQ